MVTHTDTPPTKNIGGNMKKALIVLGAILLTALIAGSSFYAGMAYQTNQVDQARLSFDSSRGQAPGGGSSQTGPGFPPDGMLNGTDPASPGDRGTAGQVKTIEGNVMTLSTAQDVTTVNLTDDTEIKMTVAGTSTDLTPGMRIMVNGENDGEGSITANQITILDSDPAGSSDVFESPYPPAAETEP
jgi:hypothetical protein